MSSIICGRCHGEGECYSEPYGWGICHECGGEGRVDEYQEDEWYEDDEEDYDYDPDDSREWTPPTFPLLIRVKLWFRNRWWRWRVKRNPLQFDDDEEDIPF